MKPRVTPAQLSEQSGAAPPRGIDAEDLTGSPESRALWRRRGRPAALPSPSRPGRPSPLGFWLAQSPESPIDPGSPLRLELLAPGEEPEELTAKASPSEPGARPTQTIRVKGPNPADGDLVLTIGPAVARVVASAATWDALAEPVVLAVCQYWRFLAVDRQLERLTEQAEGDLGHAAMSVPSTLWNRKRLLATAREVRALLLDLPRFAEPLTDPSPFCSSERSVQTFRTLAEKLHLDEWSEAIDAEAEMVEDTYAGVTEKLFEYRNFAWGAFLEVLIVVILLSELAVQVIAHFIAE